METVKLYELKKIQSEFPKQKITQSYQAADFIKGFYGDDIEIFESFFILLLNRSNHTIGYAKISQGGTIGTIVDLKLIAKYCVDSLAQGVILAHNHPSGNINFSQADVDVTQKIKKALSYLDVEVIDHIVLTKSAYSSMADDNQL